MARVVPAVGSAAVEVGTGPAVAAGGFDSGGAAAYPDALRLALAVVAVALAASHLYHHQQRVRLDQKLN